MKGAGLLNLHVRLYGDKKSPPLVILHGLFGSSDNWHSLANLFAQTHFVLVPDARNHGLSPWTDHSDYSTMAEDTVELLRQNDIVSTSVLGHSMGGKTAMETALLYPEYVDKLIVVDIAPKSYPGHHDAIFSALASLDPADFTSRKQIDEALRLKVPEEGLRNFLLKNLRRNAGGTFSWKMNFNGIRANYGNILAGIPGGRTYTKPVLFIRGELSVYIGMDDLNEISGLFPTAELVTIQGAGHTVHADKPDKFAEIVEGFLS